MDRKVHNVNRAFESEPGEVQLNAIRTLVKRSDKGAPWYGDAIAIVDAETNGNVFATVVNIPYPR